MEAEGRPLVVRTTSAKGDERNQVNPLLKKVKHLTAKTWKKGKASVLEADKGYDAQRVRGMCIIRVKSSHFRFSPRNFIDVGFKISGFSSMSKVY